MRKLKLKTGPEVDLEEKINLPNVVVLFHILKDREEKKKLHSKSCKLLVQNILETEK